jgi:twitching motility protein PilI
MQAAGRAEPAAGGARFGLRLADFGLLVAEGTLSEIVTEPVVYPIPKTPAWIRGLINLRGNLVPVFDLHILLGLGEPEADRKRLALVLGRGEGAGAVFIDALPQAVDTRRRMQQLPPLPVPLQEHVTAAYIDAGVPWLEFSHERLFAALAM